MNEITKVVLYNHWEDFINITSKINKDINDSAAGAG